MASNPSMSKATRVTQITRTIQSTLRITITILTLAAGWFFQPFVISNAEAGPIDDCGFLYQSVDGCLLFNADYHSGTFRLANYGSFVAGNRVHVSGTHDPNCFGPCGSSCIQANSISEGCSQLCSGTDNDANNDGRMNIGDVLLVIQYIFFDFQNFSCLEQADCNFDAKIEIDDLTCMVSLLF